MAQRSGFAADVQRKDDGRVRELKLCVVVTDLCGLDAEHFPVLLDGCADAADVDGHMKSVSHDTSNQSTCIDIASFHRHMSIFEYVESQPMLPACSPGHVE